MNISGVQTCLDGIVATISKKLFIIYIYKAQLIATKPKYEFICIKTSF